MKRRDLLLAVIALLMLWQVAAMILRQPILPSPIAVAGVFWRELSSGELGGHFLVSLWRVLASTFLAIIIAAPLGVILGQSQRLNNLLSPVIYLSYPIPKVVLVPIVLLFFGIGNLPKIIIIFLILFFQILVLVRDQAPAIRRELIQSVRSLGAGRRALFRYVYLPASVPAVLTALRLSVGTRITRFKNKGVFCGSLEFGASKHVASIVLAAMSSDPHIRSVVNIRYTEKTLQACRRLGFSLGSFDRKDEPATASSTMEWGTKQAILSTGFAPDIISDTGGVGKEPMIRVLGKNPQDVLIKIKKIVDASQS